MFNGETRNAHFIGWQNFPWSQKNGSKYLKIVVFAYEVMTLYIFQYSRNNWHNPNPKYTVF